jgi:hypothetical protein
MIYIFICIYMYKKVWLSDVGIVAMGGLLAAWARACGPWHVAALYLGPLTVTNVWLVLYTWLQVCIFL